MKAEGNVAYSPLALAGTWWSTSQCTYAPADDRHTRTPWGRDTDRAKRPLKQLDKNTVRCTKKHRGSVQKTPRSRLHASAVPHKRLHGVVLKGLRDGIDCLADKKVVATSMQTCRISVRTLTYPTSDVSSVRTSFQTNQPKTE